MTQYLKSLYLCIVYWGIISCQTNESITQDEEIQTIMEGISNQAGQEKNPYLTAGDKTYIIGTQDGNFLILVDILPERWEEFGII